MSSLICTQSKFIVAEPGASYSQDNSGNSVLGSERFVEVLVYFGSSQTITDLKDIEPPKLYTYRFSLQMNLKLGCIVTIPVRNQLRRGIVIRFIEQLSPNLKLEEIKTVASVDKGYLPESLCKLLTEISNYYQIDLIEVIRTSLPPGLLSTPQLRIRLIKDALPPGACELLRTSAKKIISLLLEQDHDLSWKEVSEKVINAQQGRKDLLDRGWIELYSDDSNRPKPKLKTAICLAVDPFVVEKLHKRHREILIFLKNNGSEMWLSNFVKACNTIHNTIKVLAEKGYIEIEEREVLRLAQELEQAQDQPKQLNHSQLKALEIINNLSGYSQVLLHGVTGSGKTEVYLQAIAPVINQQKSVILLVPEIGLTPQLTDRVRARFGDKVLVYHSGFQTERYDTWRQMLTGDAYIIIGTRSAIFAPLPKLGLIILDEEHDSSFKQDQPSPCYHARKVAQWRAELENCPLILGSATPSLESWLEIKHKTQQNRFYLSLPERIQARPLPPIKIVDMRQELRQGNRSIFSYDLQTALHQLKETRQQGILFIHRRGHSTFVSCRSCGYVMECPHCDVSLAYHHEHPDAAQLLRCHYCNYSQLYPQRCPDCDSPYFKHFGSGTQRVTEELNRLFPELKCIRFDSDTTSRKNAHRTLLTQFANGEADLLVGTQMLTKGLDLASVSLVGIVSADGLLHLSDYRASERAFQTLVQVAGRAGRGNDPGQVILQTYTPEHPVIQAVQRHDYESFVATELQQRQELNYPPYGRLILLRLSSFNQQDVEETAKKLAEFLLENNLNTDFELLGPAPAPILRVANRYRWQILIKTSQESSIILPKFSEFNSSSVYITIDIDPLHL
ncbi:primosomal protein N' [Planktothrix sp. FACHB-1365]|uniref:primosomal protein N' n=1 Tax=Planktothrix sp. FACHB-1365 TaxID=2692855 RepID=UPI0016898FB4|nr:primosomal protein N' [Planktothrix sp. FACHB-1365]MBD2481070.1 primosomal protein N' [Planktothrix sp. FACHB-1365]